MHIDGVLAALAGRRRGIVTYAELIAAGLTRRQVHHRVQTGHLIRLHQGVYAVGHEYLGPLARGAAAQLAAGPRSLLTHAYSLALHSVMPFPASIDVAVPRGGARPSGLVVHRPRVLPAWTLKHGLRTTLLPRALLDFATVTTRDQLTQAVNQAYVGGKTNTTDLRRIIKRGHRGCVPLGSVVDGPRTRSHLELRLLALLRAGRLPPPDDTNVKVNGHLVDFVWRTPRVVAETDGWGPHGGYGAFNTDRSRDLDHTAAHWRPIRITHQHLTKESHALIARLARVLDAAVTYDRVISPLP